MEEIANEQRKIEQGEIEQRKTEKRQRQESLCKVEEDAQKLLRAVMELTAEDIVSEVGRLMEEEEKEESEKKKRDKEADEEKEMTDGLEVRHDKELLVYEELEKKYLRTVVPDEIYEAERERRRYILSTEEEEEEAQRYKLTPEEQLEVQCNDLSVDIEAAQRGILRVILDIPLTERTDVTTCVIDEEDY